MKVFRSGSTGYTPPTITWVPRTKSTPEPEQPFPKMGELNKLALRARLREELISLLLPFFNQEKHRTSEHFQHFHVLQVALLNHEREGKLSAERAKIIPVVKAWLESQATTSERIRLLTPVPMDD